MIYLHRLPIRLRITFAFAFAMAVLFAGIGVGLYLSTGAALLDGIDTGLRSRAATIEVGVRTQIPALTPTDNSLVTYGEEFAQIARADGSLVQSSLHGQTSAVVPAGVLGALTDPTLFEQRVAGIDDVARVLAVPVKSGTAHLVIIVGSSMRDRADALALLIALVAVGGPVALVLASLGGWLLTGRALRPVERLRQQASAISVSGLDRHLAVPEPEDEISRLARTLNAMLDRLRESFESEHRFLDNASHELRTPLAVLKTELELALSRPRNPEELNATIVSAAEEADRLALLSDDLLVLSRAHQGRLPVHRAETSLDALIDAAHRCFRGRAEAAGVRIESDAPKRHVVVDGMRLREAIDNLLDNAVRHTPAGGSVRVRAEVEEETLSIVVEDDGPGFCGGFEQEAFEPFARGAAATRTQSNTGYEGAGLGLAIVRAITQGHGGTVTAQNRPEGGARLTLTIGSVVRKWASTPGGRP